ncbi:MAG: hypothetical protein HBSIN02_24860 [Bacteroidia bacterium]|nr:MAG: hypothetical protein HBSIN02_24860 [Bacteroidia bacterium]
MEPQLNIANDPVPVFTIGYGSRTIDDFLDLLSSYQIEFLIDIRSKPYSQYKIEFSRNALEKTLEHRRIRYVFMGDLLGGQPEDPECYTNGKVDYSKCQAKDFHKQGLSRIKKAWEGKHRVALMCSEGKPQECHRSKMVGDSLARLHIPVMHIDEVGQLKSQQEVIDLIQGKEPQLNLFESVKLAFSRKRYRKA